MGCEGGLRRLGPEGEVLPLVGEESISSKVSSTRPDTDPVLAAGPFLGVRWRSRVLEGRVENSLDPIVRLRDALLPMELPMDENLVLRHLRVEVPPLIPM